MNTKEFFHKYPDAPRNTNCLVDVGCPNCGNRYEFFIAATALFIFGDDGTSNFEGDVDYDETAFAVCRECHEPSRLSDFYFLGLDKLYEARDRMIGGAQ